MTAPSPVYPRFRRIGTYVVWQGREYRAGYDFRRDMVTVIVEGPENPDPSRYEWNDYRRGWCTEVPVTECERIYRVATYTRYWGARCEVLEFAEDGVSVSDRMVPAGESE